MAVIPDMLVRFESAKPKGLGNVYLSNEVYTSPEFKAFCERFGIAWELRTRDMTIFLPFDGAMTVTQEYQVGPRDQLPPADEPDVVG